MAYEVDIQFVPTGEIRTTKHQDEWKSDPTGDLGIGDTAFYWSDGNMACDCNRSDAFRRAGGQDRDPEQGCGNNRYRVVAVRDGSGNPIDYPAES